MNGGVRFPAFHSMHAGKFSLALENESSSVLEISPV